jgi:hypothetical protein
VIAAAHLAAVGNAVFVPRALDAALAIVTDRSRRRAPRGVRADGRGSTLELVEIATRLRRRAVDVGGALRATSANTSRRRGGTIAVHRALRASLREDVADRLALPAVGVLIALHARARRRVAELRSAISALRVLSALRMAFVIARPARRRARAAICVRAARLTAPRQAERGPRSAVSVADALHASERGIAFPSAARAGRAREVAAATDEAAVLALATARDDDHCREREGNHPVLHGPYGSLPAR